MNDRTLSGLILPGTPPEMPNPAMAKYALPGEPELVTVTHDMAGDFLDYRSRPGSGHQRKLSLRKARGYADVMDAGMWRETPLPLMFDVNGWMFDGQHRMQALRYSRLDSFRFWVHPGQDPALFDVVDNGYPRQARQLYSGTHATTVCGAVRYLGEDKGEYQRTMSNTVQLAEVAKWPELQTHARAVDGLANKVRIPAAAHLAILAQAERTEHRDKIPGWLDGLLTGYDLGPGDLRAHLRERFLISKVGSRDQDLVYCLIAKAWNLYVTGERRQVLTWRVDEGMISVIGTGADLSTGLFTKE